jgi:hypothetical protein
MLQAVGELIKVSPGDHLSIRIHYDETEGAWVLEIGVVLNPVDKPLEFIAGKTSTLKVATPFMGANPLYDSPYKGNTSCPDYHRFVLGDLHEAWNMNTPSFYPTKQTWDVQYTARNFGNMTVTNSCCKHVGNKCDACPPGAVTVMEVDIETNEQGHIKFSVARSTSPDLHGSAATVAVVSDLPVAALVLPMEILVNKTSGLPRFVVGQVVVGGRLQHVTFDAGNPKASILTAAGCLGCGDGCPHVVPSCAAPGAQFCSPSAPQEYVPASAYTVNASRRCDGGTGTAGALDGSPVCQQCFDGGDHARFYHLATADVSVVASTGPVTFKAMDFGALVRVTPLQVRKMPSWPRNWANFSLL